MCRFTRTLIVPLFLICTCSWADARAFKPWPYASLLKEADCVVIARAVKTVDTREKIGALDPRIYTAVNTTFEIQAVMKGEVKEPTLVLLHLRLSGEEPLLDGAALADFEQVHERGAAPTAYLLFLKRRGDGRFEPVSDQYDAVLSFRRLEHLPPAPTPDEQEKPAKNEERK